METSTNPSPKVILHGFVHVTMKVLNSYVLCSKTQFTEEVKRLAKENKVLLVTLTDLYQL